MTAGALNVRSGPSTGDAVLGQAHAGESYPNLEQRGAWHRIQFGARDGWCHGSFLQPSTKTVTRVTASALNVRSGADASYRQLGQLARDQQVVILATSGAWRQIAFEGQRAFVHGAYLAGTGVAPPAPGSGRRSSRAGLIQIAASGAGFNAYSLPGRRWGRPQLIYGIERTGARWAPLGWPRIGVGEISLENGGPMPPHVTHREGKNADIRPVRTSGEGPVTIYQAAYSRSRTQRLIDLMRAETSARSVLFNDTGVRGVSTYPGHHNHFHLSIP
ncbi:MAG: penicillin-insensitive murein endopeptidase [Planctomycetota bacterium]